MSNALTITQDQTEFTAKQLSVLENLGVQGAAPQEIAMFFDYCQRTGLSPWARQIYMIGRWDKKLGRQKYVVQVSIDGQRLFAERSGEYEGQTAPQWCGPDGQWVDVWLADEPPQAARVGVWRKNFREPTYCVARLSSYMPLTRDGRPQGLWGTMPDVMLAKCAESLALRKTFPIGLSGLYTTEEMQQADAPRPEPGPVDTDVHEDVVDAEIVDDEERMQWLEAIKTAETREALLGLWGDIKNAPAGLQAELRELIPARAKELAA